VSSEGCRVGRREALRVDPDLSPNPNLDPNPNLPCSAPRCTRARRLGLGSRGLGLRPLREKTGVTGWKTTPSPRTPHPVSWFARTAELAARCRGRYVLLPPG